MTTLDAQLKMAEMDDLLRDITAEIEDVVTPKSGENVVIYVRGNARNAIVEVNGWAKTSKNGISTMMSCDEADELVLTLLEQYPSATLNDARR